MYCDARCELETRKECTQNSYKAKQKNVIEQDRGNRYRCCTFR